MGNREVNVRVRVSVGVGVTITVTVTVTVTFPATRSREEATPLWFRSQQTRNVSLWEVRLRSFCIQMYIWTYLCMYAVAHAHTNIPVHVTYVKYVHVVCKIFYHIQTGTGIML